MARAKHPEADAKQSEKENKKNDKPSKAIDKKSKTEATTEEKKKRRLRSETRANIEIKRQQKKIDTCIRPGSFKRIVTHAALAKVKELNDERISSYSEEELKHVEAIKRQERKEQGEDYIDKDDTATVRIAKNALKMIHSAIEATMIETLSNARFNKDTISKGIKTLDRKHVVTAVHGNNDLKPIMSEWLKAEVTKRITEDIKAESEKARRKSLTPDERKEEDAALKAEREIVRKRKQKQIEVRKRETERKRAEKAKNAPSESSASKKSKKPKTKATEQTDDSMEVDIAPAPQEDEENDEDEDGIPKSELTRKVIPKATRNTRSSSPHAVKV